MIDFGSTFLFPDKVTIDQGSRILTYNLWLSVFLNISIFSLGD